jgi:single-strand DNA-binding protein
MTFQQITLVGNVGGVDELKETNGVFRLGFSLAVNKVTGRGETRQEKTIWFRVTLWRERAENGARMITKGSKVLVVGEVEGRAYTDKNGQTAVSLDVTASEFKMLSSRQDGEGGGYGGGGNYQGQSAPSGSRGGSGSNVEDPNDIPF